MFADCVSKYHVMLSKRLVYPCINFNYDILR